MDQAAGNRGPKLRPRGFVDFYEDFPGVLGVDPLHQIKVALRNDQSRLGNDWGWNQKNIAATERAGNVGLLFVVRDL